MKSVNVTPGMWIRLQCLAKVDEPVKVLRPTIDGPLFLADVNKLGLYLLEAEDTLNHGV